LAKKAGDAGMARAADTQRPRRLEPFRQAAPGMAIRRIVTPAVHREAMMSSTNTDSARPAPDDAVALLTSDHDKVRQMFLEFEAIRSEYDQFDLKSELVEQICFELTVHTLLEEEIFYPALLEATGNAALLERAGADHADAKELISQLEGMEPTDQQYDGTVVQLANEIERHISFEERDMFRQARSCGLDLASVGRKIIERKEEIELDFDGGPVSKSRGSGARAPGKPSHP
jgi:hemerythrin-like domain-containing protein